MITQLLSNRVASILLASVGAVACLCLGTSMSLRPGYWASLPSLLVPEANRKEPNPFAPAPGWRRAGSFIVWIGLAFTGIALWLMLSMSTQL